MAIIAFGYDKPAGHERGYAREDWSLKAAEDPRGFGWQLIDRHGNRSRHVSKEEALARLAG